MKKLLFGAALLFQVCSLFAQEELTHDSISLETDEALAVDLQVYADSVEILNERLGMYMEQCTKDSLEINALSLMVDSLSSCIMERDRKIAEDSVKTNEILLRAERMRKEAMAKSEKADTIAIQMMITYLDLKCPDERIEKLRRNFANIPNRMLRDEYMPVDRILSLYSITRQSIISLAEEELKTKKIASEANELHKDIYKDNYRRKLDALVYVKSYYRNEEFTSQYLNRMLDISYKALEENNMEMLKDVVNM